MLRATDSMKILITCPPMLGIIDEFKGKFRELDLEIATPNVVQTLTVPELIELIPDFDGWIIGDDPVTRDVLAAGKRGSLKAAVKWGIGVDNVDFEAAKEFGISIRNTPGMFGQEVADIAIGYLIGLARETFKIDREVRRGAWPKPCGISLGGKIVGLVGYGDIGRNCAKRMLMSGMEVQVYDPAFTGESDNEKLSIIDWPTRLDRCDFIVFTCSLNMQNKGMLNANVLEKCKNGIRIINVARGGLIEQSALEDALASGKVHSVALDVMEDEPLPMNSRLRNFDSSIFGSHNASNTIEAVRSTSDKAIAYLIEMLRVD